MAGVKHTFVKGLDNERGLELLDNGVPLTATQYQAFTSFSLSFVVIGGTPQTFTSTAHPEMVRYDSVKNRLLIETGGLGLAADDYQARLVGYSSDQPKGIVLADYEQYEVTIRD
jgi:hypothetical protein